MLLKVRCHANSYFPVRSLGFFASEIIIPWFQLTLALLFLFSPSLPPNCCHYQIMEVAFLLLQPALVCS